MYVKAKLGDVEIKVDIKPDNIYYTCGHCGEEHLITAFNLMEDFCMLSEDDNEDDVLTKLRYCPNGCRFESQL